MDVLTKSKSYPWILVILYSLLGVTFPAAVTQFSMVVSDLAQVMNVGQQTILLADSLRAICLVCAMFLSGYVYKKLGLRKTLALGMFFQISSQFLVPLAVNLNSIPLFYLFKGMQGLNSMAFPLYISTITLWMDKKYVGLSTAIFNGSFVAGGGIGAWISGKIVPVLGWQISFYVIGALCLIMAIPVLLITRDKENLNVVDNKESIKDKKVKGKGVYGIIIKNPITWLLVVSLIANTWIGQAITVDMSVYAGTLGYKYEQIGGLMMIISIVTVVSSILAGAVSDFFAIKSKDSVKSRCIVLALGYALSTVAAFLLPFFAERSFSLISILSGSMMFGASWAAGVFWAIPSEVYAEEEQVAGTAFCSGASNIPNPIAPMIVGVLLGTRGLWMAGWLTCSVVSVLSLVATILIPVLRKNQG